MDDLFDAVAVRGVLKTLVLPPTGPLLLALVGLLLRPRRPRLGRALAALGVVGLLVLSIPVVSLGLYHLADDSRPFDPATAARAQAVVVLGGGVRRDAPDFGGDTLSRLTLERVRYGARVARLTGLPVLVSGGRGRGDVAEAVLMRDALEREFLVPVRWVEDRSRSTRENAERTAEILRPLGVREVVLVVHGIDMRRARAEFAAAGLSTVPAPTGLAPAGPRDFTDFLPSLTGLTGSYYALYELLGEAWRRVFERG